jgi:putative ABC transport system permease protein
LRFPPAAALAAWFHASNTMDAAAASAREIGTLRAPRFPGWRTVTAFLAGSVAPPLAGGVIGCMLALLTFTSRVTPALAAGVMLSAGLMGAAGGVLPAIRAGRIPVARALRENLS